MWHRLWIRHRLISHLGDVGHVCLSCLLVPIYLLFCFPKDLSKATDSLCPTAFQAVLPACSSVGSKRGKALEENSEAHKGTRRTRASGSFNFQAAFRRVCISKLKSKLSVLNWSTKEKKTTEKRKALETLEVVWRRKLLNQPSALLPPLRTTSSSEPQPMET